MEITNLLDALNLVGKTIKIKPAKYFSDKHILNKKYLENIYANFQNKKCEILNYYSNENGKFIFEVFNGKKACYLYNEDFDLI